MTKPTEDHLGKIAVIGLAGRYPAARDLEQFWANLKAGRDCITFFTDEELVAAGGDRQLISRPDYVKAYGVYEDTYAFDAPFFSYSPREAELIDPQQRVFLECAWEALEHAGYDISRYQGRVGVWAGCGQTRYLNQLLARRETWSVTDSYSLAIHNEKDFLTTRVAYKLNLRGPCVTVQTACSTSLVSVILACQSLLTYQCDMALAGGVALAEDERSGYVYQEGGVHSPDGRCRAFDAAARGIVNGSGVGVVALKRLEEALADRDTVHAVILGFGLNNDGASRVGFTAPGLDGQVTVYSDAISMAGINPETIGYVECHGTGTPIGDPIEIAALTKAYRAYTQKKGFCAVGSVKTNIGHTDAAAGIAGFTKAVLALKHKLIPPSLHFERPNPEIDFESTPFYVNTALREWNQSQTPRRAAVTSLGVGGTNAHLILEEAPSASPSPAARSWQLLTWSAKTEAALETMTSRLSRHLKAQPTEPISDLAYTLHVGRQAFSHRRALIGQTREEVIASLDAPNDDHVITAVTEGKPDPVAFLFPGQGAQYPDMAKDLYLNLPAFRRQVDFCAEVLRPELRLDLREIIYPRRDRPEAASEQLSQTQYAQSALFVIEYALARLWMEWGVQPEVMIGHSVGEYVAACLAGVFSVEEGLQLVAARGLLMGQLPRGSMISVLTSEREIRSSLQSFKELSLAAVNGPSTVVVSGPCEEIAGLERHLQRQGAPYRRLMTSHAFHSAMTEPILDKFRNEVRRVTLKEPRVPYISNVSGTWISPDDATDPDYWVKHLRYTVRFADGVDELLRAPRRMFLEVGPGRTLTSLIRRQVASEAVRVQPSLCYAKDDPQSELKSLLTAVGRLWAEGLTIDWGAFHSGGRHRRLPLPTYPFEKQVYRLAHSWGQSTPSVPAPKFREAGDVAQLLYCPSWKRSAPVSRVGLSGKRHWLIFPDQCGLGAEIAARLRAEGGAVVSVDAGDRFAQTGSVDFVLCPGDREQYRALLAALRSAGKLPDDIVFLWPINAIEEDNSGLDSLEETLDKTFYSLTWLASALAHEAPGHPCRIHVLSNGVHEVVGETVLCPVKATLLGPCRVISLEHPEIKCRNIDVQIPAESSARVHLLDLMLAEFDDRTDDIVIAYRACHRWVQTFVPDPISGAGGENFRLRDKGVYLITGALGGLGLTFAEYLAEACRAKLVLVGRSPFPRQDRWEACLDRSDTPAALSGQIQRLLRIKQTASEVMVASADVSNRSQMAALIAQIRARFGTIHGVIHAAGVPGGGIMELKTRAQAEAVLAPKVKGTLILAELLNDLPPDFFILCSSLTGILGTQGQIDYTAANAFLDAFACSARGIGASAVSIGWNGWTQVGMRAAFSARTDRGGNGRPDQDEITPAEGCEILRRILSGPLKPQVVVSRRSLALWHSERASLQRQARAHNAPHNSSAGVSATHARPNLRTAYVKPCSALETAICEVWRSVFGIAEIGIHDNFIELGGHSLLAIHLTARLREQFGVDFTVTDLYKRPTVAGLAEAVTSSIMESAGQEYLQDMIDELEPLRVTESDEITN